MDELRKKFKRGQIDKETYQEKMTELTIFHLEVMNYKYVGRIAEGVHGVVVEMKSPETVLNVAVKIVFEDLEPGFGMISWPKLIHENITPLITWRTIKEANSKVFITLKYDKTLQNKIASFRCDYSGFEKAVTCIQDITNGINYLHHQDLCHLNLSPDRIFIAYNNKARLGGFGYLTSKDSKDPKFGTAPVFRPPEACRGTQRKIDGQKFDIWSLGVLAIETFTGLHLSKEISKWQAQPETWHLQVYELMYEVLEKENFYGLVKKNFPNWEADYDKLGQALSFIQSCLMFNHEDRPSADDLLKHRLLGGHIEKYWPKEEPDIWAEIVNSVELVMIALQKRNLNLSDSDIDISDDENNDDTEGEHLNDNTVLEANIKEELSIESEKAEKDFEILLEKSKPSNLVGCAENVSSKNDDNKETPDICPQKRDATVKNDYDYSLKDNPVKIKASDYETDANMKNADCKDSFIAPDLISDKIEISNDRDVKKDKIIYDEKNKKVSAEERAIAMKKMIEEIDIRLKMIDKINLSNTDSEKTNIKMKEEKIEITENVNDDMNVSNRNTDGKKIRAEIDKKYKDLNAKEKINDVRNKTKKLDFKENVTHKNDTLVSDRGVKKDKIDFDQKNKTLNEEGRENSLKEAIKEREIKEKVIHIVTSSNIDKDVKEEKLESKTNNQVVNMKEKTNQLTKECIEIKITENLTNDMSTSNRSGGVKDEKTGFNKANKDINMKEKINAIKKKNNGVEIKENGIDDINITVSDKVVKKDETEFHIKDKDPNMKPKTDDTKNKAEKSEIIGNVFDMSNKDRDVKENKSEYDEENEYINAKKEKNGDILDKSIANLNEIEYVQINKTDAVHNIIEHIEPLQFELNYAPVLESNSDKETLTDSFERNRRKKKLKRRRKKEKSLNFPINSNTNTHAKPERIDYETEMKKKKQYYQTFSEEYESSSLSNTFVIQSNDENVYQRPRHNLRKARPNDKYLEIQEYKHSYSTEKKSLENNVNANPEYSVNACEKRDDTNRKKKSAKKPYSPKYMIENIEPSPATSSSKKQRSSRKTYSHNSVIEKVDQPIAVSSSEKQRSTRKAYSSKYIIEKVEPSPATSSSKKQRSSRKTYSHNSVKEKVYQPIAISPSEKQRSTRKTYSTKTVIEKVTLSPVTSSEKIQDDGNYDLEPGEVHLFKKDYHKNKERPKYSVASHSSAFNNFDEESLEEGEIDPNNPGFNCDLKSRRFKNLRSWWKRQKKNLTNCFTACLRTSDVK